MPARTTWQGVVESGIRKHRGPKGEHWYRVQMGRRGKGNRASRVVRTLEEAIALKREWEAGGVPAARPAGEEAPAPEPPVQTVEDALRVYQLERPQARTDIRSTRSVIARHFPALLGFRVEAVTADHFLVFRRAYAASGRKDSGCNTHMNTLRAGIRRCRPDFTVPKEVFPLVPRLRHPRLTPLEARQAFLAAPEPFTTMARIAALTFMRQSEIRLLRRGQVDFTTRTITLFRAKAGPRVVSMGDEAAEILRRVLASHGHDVVFPRHPRRAGRHAGKPYSRGHVSNVWHDAIVRAGRRGFTFHDLRHHAAMTALANGASFPELQALGGWARPDMVNRYATASNDRLRELQDLGARGLGRHAGRRRAGA